MAWAARWRAALTRARTSATRALEIGAAAFSLGSGSLGGSDRLTSLALGCAHNNAIPSWRAPISSLSPAQNKDCSLVNPGRDSENLCPPALLQLGSRSVGEERGLEGSAGTIATCTELCLASCPRDNRTVPLQLAPDVARCNPLAPSRLEHSDGLYQFPAQTSSSRGRSRMLTRSKGRNHNLNARS